MLLRTTLLTLLVLCVPVLAQKVAGDLKKMQGTWALESEVEDGKAAPAKEIKGIRLTIKGNQSTLIAGKDKSTATYKLDESKTPRTLDVTLTSGEDKGKKMLGIYELKGDQMRICLTPPGGKKRPAKFESKAGSDLTLEVWKRAR